MSEAVPRGVSKPLIASSHPGTQVLFRWALWQIKRAAAGKQAFRIGVFRKGDVRLVVYQYERNLCGVVKKADVAPKFRDFREWREPFATVKGKLVKRGWVLGSDSEEEVGHGAH